MDLLKAHFVADIGQIREKLSRDLLRSKREAGLIAIVFANAKKRWVQDNILPLVNYWNYRSRDDVTFFFVGYIGDERAGEDQFFAILDESAESFGEGAFVKAIEHFETHTTWRYEHEHAL